MYSLIFELINNASYVARWGMPENYANSEYFCVDAVGEMLASIISVIFILYREFTVAGKWYYIFFTLPYGYKMAHGILNTIKFCESKDPMYELNYPTNLDEIWKKESYNDSMKWQVFW